MKSIARVVMMMLASAAWRTAPAADDPRLAPQTGYLVLRNGEALRGQITCSGDRYYVSDAKQELGIRAAEVEFFCRTLEEGYQRKQRTVNVRRVQDRLTLAEWCLRHGLTTEADEQLRAAAALDARHPRLSQLQRRLEAAQTSARTPRLPSRPPLKTAKKTITSQSTGNSDPFDPDVFNRKFHARPAANPVQSRDDSAMRR